MDLGTGLETIRPWIGTGGILGCLAFAARVWLMNRKLTMQDRAEQHKQDLEDGDFERKGYGQIISVMQSQIDSLVSQVKDLQTQLNECRTEHATSKATVAQLTAQVSGLHRQIVMHSASAAVSLGPTASPAVVEAAHRAHGIVSGEG